MAELIVRNGRHFCPAKYDKKLDTLILQGDTKIDPQKLVPLGTEICEVEEFAPEDTKEAGLELRNRFYHFAQNGPRTDVDYVLVPLGVDAEYLYSGNNTLKISRPVTLYLKKPGVISRMFERKH